MTTTVNSSTATTATSSTATSLTATSAADLSSQFLKMLVAQMKNQDPLNPTDNAQITSQMAQISTVSQLGNVNTAISGLTTQFGQLQAIQGVGLMGHEVTVAGNQLRVAGSAADAAFQLPTTASAVQVQVLDASGNVVDTIKMSNVSAGVHSFNWTVPTAQQGKSLHFAVTAQANGQDITATALENQKITAVSSANNTLAIELANGQQVSYGDVLTVK
jgi:flagellar basal-body rod modification protein FlgD